MEFCTLVISLFAFSKGYPCILKNEEKGSAGMVLSNAYNYINVLDKAADASWTRNDVLANNIANATTPGYKRKDVQFETYLSNAVAGTDSLDETIAKIDLSDEEWGYADNEY